MNPPKDREERPADGTPGYAGGTAPSGGQLDEEMGGVDNTTDDFEQARQAARDRAEREQAERQGQSPG